MPESKQILAYDEPSKTFAGCHFVLLGFDPVRKEELLSRLLEGGGKDAINYGSDCTHVIVDNLVYDDPICITARRDGKILVTGMWVDHSFDVGMPVDPTSIIYRPIKDLNGIPGAQSLIVCLTGYQRQDRDDIMTMVGLMGANFSKPLVANKVTHLICYKFEGEKYELAKKIKKIKLVNHRWLEHCLKAWKILPEDDYYKSGYELEMEAEAKDSEEETEDVASVIDLGRQNVASAQITRVQNENSHQSPIKQEVLRNGLYSSESRSCANIGTVSEDQSIPGKEIYFDKTSPLQESHYRHLEMPSFCSTRSMGKISSEMPLNILDDTVISEKVGNVSASDKAKKSPFDDGLKSSSKPDFRSTSRKSSIPLSSKRTETMRGSPSVSNVSKLWVTGDTSMPSETHLDGTDFDKVETPLKVSMLHLNEGQTAVLSEKKKTTVRGSPQSPGINNVPKTLMESKSAAQKTKVLASGCSADGPHAMAGQVSPTTDTHHLGEEASLTPKEALNISNGAILEDGQECSDITPRRSCRAAKKRSFSSNLDGNDLTLTRTKYSFDEVEMHQTDLPNIKPLSPRTNTSRVEKSIGQEGLDFTKARHADPQVKPLKRKMLVKKTLGSRPSFYKGGTTKHECSIKKAVIQNENIIDSVGAVATEDTDNATITEKVVMVSPTSKNRSQKTKTNNLHESQEKTTEENGPLNDENKTPDDEGEPNWVRNKKESAEVEEEPQSGNICPSKRAGINNAEKQPHAKVIRRKKKVANFEAKSSAEPEKGTHGKKIEMDELIPTDDPEEEKITESKKHPLTKSKTNKFKDPRKEAKETGFSARQDKKKDVAGNEDTVQFAGKTKTRPSKKLKSSSDVEKENEPVTIRCQSPSNDDSIAARKVGPEPLKKPLKRSLKADKANPDSAECGQDLEVKTDHAWFILSGHRLQRKEFQQVIRRLKGRVCRDSHHWSYQATHFIVPDPIRRTEKFFAAAASGSWILKTDYLTASNEVGKLLSEEPFEWHKKCLSEDGAINLEAPRKWRLLRERTGHGAFYGMRIIIYGECIAPPLDTLKRVVKAGDGTILATSPPYTRFFQSRIDFAIVSPGMPRVDMWVQEFLRHEVPCVVADYLVEYVCKPGYSLERHVQYNTHSWAKKSLDNLINQVEEDPRTPEDQSTDVACQVCQSRDRGEEMLICGDESGTFGCGIGTHIDCLDPPLTDVPEEDWFCLACCKIRESRTISQSPNKHASKSKK